MKNDLIIIVVQEFTDDRLGRFTDIEVVGIGEQIALELIIAVGRVSDILEESKVGVEVIAVAQIEEFLGNKKYLPDTISNKDEIGIVNGLAWTSVGGELLPIEVALMDGAGKLELTGSLGDVMKESAKIAINCIRSHADALGIDSDFYKNKDIHIHAPEGAVPKDGPSAGITMATAIYSALSCKAVRHDVAMTGEITLRGKVLPIGGLKEKSMAAYKHGISTVIIPKQNEADIEEFDDAVKENVTFVPVESFREVISLAIRDSIKVTDRDWNKMRIPSAKSSVARVTQ